MRSDFANEDIEKREVDDDEYKLLGSEEFSGVDCYMVERISKKQKDTNYSKRIRGFANAYYNGYTDDPVYHRDYLTDGSMRFTPRYYPYQVIFYRAQENRKIKDRDQSHNCSPRAAVLSRVSKVKKNISGSCFLRLIAVARCQRSAPRKGHLSDKGWMDFHSGDVFKLRQGPLFRTSKAAFTKTSAREPSLFIRAITAHVST
jgi:hypothetical protein